MVSSMDMVPSSFFVRAGQPEALYYKEVDDIIIRQLKEIRNPNVEIITIPGNLDTEEWGIQAAHHMVDELKEHAVIGDEIQY